MRQKFLKPFIALFCAVSAFFVFSSFTVEQTRGGGDDGVIRLEYTLDYGSHVLVLEEASDYVMGDFILGEGTAPYWIHFGEEDGGGRLALHVQANPFNISRNANLSFTVYTSSRKCDYEINIVQQGRDL